MSDFNIRWNPETERGRLLSEVFDEGVAPVQMPMAWINPSGMEPQPAYFLAIEELTDAQLDTLVSVVARKFKAPEDAIRAQIAADGFPVLVDGVVLEISNPGKWVY